MVQRTCSEGQKGDEGNGVGGEAPVERAGVWIVDVGHCELLLWGLTMRWKGSSLVKLKMESAGCRIISGRHAVELGATLRSSGALEGASGTKSTGTTSPSNSLTFSESSQRYDEMLEGIRCTCIKCTT